MSLVQIQYRANGYVLADVNLDPHPQTQLKTLAQIVSEIGNALQMLTVEHITVSVKINFF